MIEDDGEGNGHTVEVTVQVLGNLDREVSIYLTLVPGTATGEYEMLWSINLSLSY